MNTVSITSLETWTSYERICGMCFTSFQVLNEKIFTKLQQNIPVKRISWYQAVMFRFWRPTQLCQIHAILKNVSRDFQMLHVKGREKIIMLEWLIKTKIKYYIYLCLPACLPDCRLQFHFTVKEFYFSVLLRQEKHEYGVLIFWLYPNCDMLDISAL